MVGFWSHRYLLIVSVLKILTLVKFYLTSIIFLDNCYCNIICVFLLVVGIQSHFTFGVIEWQLAKLFLC